MSQPTGDLGKQILKFQSKHWWAGDPGEPGYSFISEASLLKKQEELMLQGKFKGKLRRNLLLEESNYFCSIQTFSLLDMAHLPYPIMKNNLLYSKSTDLSVNLTQKYSHRNTQNILCLTEYLTTPWPSQIHTYN